MESAILSGGDFKELVKKVTRFPGVGSFGDSNLINIQVSDGRATASSFGIVLSRMSVLASGECPLVALDERLVSSFAEICSDAAKVVFRLNDNGSVTIRAGHREVTGASAKGKDHPQLPDLNQATPKLIVTNEIAKKIRYLSEISYGDNSRPELNCVMISGKGYAMAANQKAVAAMVIPETQKVAIPLVLAKAILKGETLYVGEKETVLVNGAAYYCMPTLIQAQSEFPVAYISDHTFVEKQTVCTCRGNSLAKLIQECESCLGRIARTDAHIKLAVSVDRIELSSEVGTAKFRGNVKATGSIEATLVIPLAELVHVVPMIEGCDVVVSMGKNDEAYIGFPDGLVMFPSYRAAKSSNGVPKNG